MKPLEAAIVSLLISASFGLGLAAYGRISLLEQRQFHGYLYTLNPEGKWDRLKTNQLDLCKSQQCAALVFTVGEGGK